MYSRRVTSALLEESIRANTKFEKGTPAGNINRPNLAKSISSDRATRDKLRSIAKQPVPAWINKGDAKKDKAETTAWANVKDNQARLSSQTGETRGYVTTSKDLEKGKPAAQQPRLYSSKPNHN